MWTYHTDTGDLYADNGMLFGRCYSGNGAGLNNPKMESVHNIGPLPAGYYRFGDFYDDIWPIPVDGDHKGPRVCRLLAIERDETNGTWSYVKPPYDREGLLMHGDNGMGDFSASKGCLIASRFIRDAIQTGDLLHAVFGK